MRYDAEESGRGVLAFCPGSFGAVLAELGDI